MKKHELDTGKKFAVHWMSIIYIILGVVAMTGSISLFGLKMYIIASSTFVGSILIFLFAGAFSSLSKTQQEVEDLKEIIEDLSSKINNNKQQINQNKFRIDKITNDKNDDKNDET